MAPEFATVPFHGRDIRLEYGWIGKERSDAPLFIFLHEGLGSLSMWKDFPQRLCDLANYRGLVFSRYGYGRSTPRPISEKWPVHFMHEQAQDLLPKFLDKVGVNAASRSWVLGHSDGGSIALLFAAALPTRVAGLVLLAPHIFVEDLSIASIEQARDDYRSTDLRERLRRYHADPDSAFWGWNDIWLDPQFRRWNIEPALQDVRCPVLAVQGFDDPYGTMAQIDGIAKRISQARILKLAQCGHSPHRDQADALIEAVTNFVQASRA